MTFTSLAKSLPNFAQLITQLQLQFNTYYGRLLQSGIRKQWGCSTPSLGRFDQSLWMESVVIAVVAMMNWQWAVVLLVVGQVCKQRYLTTFTASCNGNYEAMAAFPWE
jgi:hypothetical protein